MARVSHLPALDGLRGLAILLVIAHNVQMLEVPEMHGGVKIAFYFLNIGWIGVQLFFVLSGFLITGILLDAVGRPQGLRHFIARRALRIFPLYYGTLFVIFVLLPAIGHQPGIYREQAPYQGWLWAYLSNWTDPLGIGPNNLPHFWSLAVEEQYYLLWPLLVFALRTPQRVALASLVLIVVGPVSRAWVLAHGYPIDAVYCWTHCRIDALAWGGLAASCWRIPQWASLMRRHAFALLGILGIIVLGTAVWTHGFARTTPRGMVLGYSVLGLAFAALIYRGAWLDDSHTPDRGQAPWDRFLRLPLLRSAGKYSYGMYVLHKPLHDLFSAPVLSWLSFDASGNVAHSIAHVFGVMVASYAAAWVSYNLYEVHFLKLKRHFD